MPAGFEAPDGRPAAALRHHAPSQLHRGRAGRSLNRENGSQGLQQGRNAPTQQKGKRERGERQGPTTNLTSAILTSAWACATMT